MCDFLNIIFQELKQNGLTEIIITHTNIKTIPRDKMYLSVYVDLGTMIKTDIQISWICEGLSSTNRFANSETHFFTTANRKIYAFDNYFDGKMLCLMCLQIYQNIILFDSKQNFNTNFTLTFNSELNICKIDSHCKITNLNWKEYFVFTNDNEKNKELDQYINLTNPVIKKCIIPFIG